MAGRRVSMRKIREVLRLNHERKLSLRQIAKSCSLARSTVQEYLRRAEEAGVAWPPWAVAWAGRAALSV